jgi:hypothetical protein
MSFDEIRNLTKGFVKGWKKGKLKEKLVETAEVLLGEKIKNSQLEEKIRQMDDEIKRLKGEKGKPKIKPASTNKELNPSPKRPHNKKQKNKNIEIDEVVELDVDKSELPGDAKRVGHREIVVQEMIIKRKNIKFIIKRYWSDELGRVIEKEIPAEFKGNQFGPQLRSFLIYQYYKCRTPQDKILQMISDWNIEMSAGTLCALLNNPIEGLQDDLSSARIAGIKRQNGVYIDDTGARIRGANGYTFGVSNEYFTQYTTGLEKNRWAAVGALLGGVQSYLIDEEAINFVANKLKRAIVTRKLSSLKGKLFKREEVEEKFKEVFDFEIRKDELDTVRTACAISALRANQNGPPIRFLVSDDGTNFNDLIKSHQLCWVHEIRKYKKLSIYHELQKDILNNVIKKWQSLYKKMKTFKLNPTSDGRKIIRNEFNKIILNKTGLSDIDELLQRTKNNQKRLLLFLRYPRLPLHSNMIETDLRERVIKRKISLQNRSWEGVRAWDLMLSLSSTCRKLGLSFWRYLEDRISQRESIPYLGKLVLSLP